MYVGLDMSLTGTGVCIIDCVGDVVFIRTIKTQPKDYKHIYQRVDAIVGQVVFMIPENSNICIESPFVHAKHISNCMGLIGLAHMMRRELWIKGLCWTDVAPTMLKKFATGKGTAKKGQISMTVLKLWGIETADDNQADAVVLAHIARCLDQRSTVKVFGYQEEVLTKLEGGK